MTFARNLRGKEIAVLCGYTFYRRSTTQTTQYWACCQSSSRACRARFLTSLKGKIMKLANDHTHQRQSKYKIVDGLYTYKKCWIYWKCFQSEIQCSELICSIFHVPTYNFINKFCTKFVYDNIYFVLLNIVACSVSITRDELNIFT